MIVSGGHYIAAFTQVITGPWGGCCVDVVNTVADIDETPPSLNTLLNKYCALHCIYIPYVSTHMLCVVSLWIVFT